MKSKPKQKSDWKFESSNNLSRFSSVAIAKRMPKEFRIQQAQLTGIIATALADAGVPSQVSAIEALSDLFNPFPPVVVVSGGV